MSPGSKRVPSNKRPPPPTARPAGHDEPGCALGTPIADGVSSSGIELEQASICRRIIVPASLNPDSHGHERLHAARVRVHAVNASGHGHRLNVPRFVAPA